MRPFWHCRVFYSSWETTVKCPPHSPNSQANLDVCPQSRVRRTGKGQINGRRKEERKECNFPYFLAAPLSLSLSLFVDGNFRPQFLPFFSFPPLKAGMLTEEEGTAIKKENLRSGKKRGQEHSLPPSFLPPSRQRHFSHHFYSWRLLCRGKGIFSLKKLP